MTDRTSLDTATRIVAADDGTNYDNVAITLHWVTAALVLFQFVSAITWDDFAKPTQQAMQSLHVSMGMLLAVVIVARIVWRLIPGHQVPSLEAGWVKLASKAVHYLLYFLIVMQVTTGFLWRWAQGHPVAFFGLGIPSPLGTVDKATRHQLHNLHQWVGWGIVIIAAGHAFAALYHHYRLHDRVLGRMFPPARRSENPA